MTKEKTKYYQIGEISKLTSLSIRTLHYYNDINLLIPDKIDPITNYRYYSHAQLARVHTIKFLKEANFNIKQMTSYLDSDDVLSRQNLLIEKRQEITEQITNLNNLKTKLDLFIDDVYLLQNDNEINIKIIPEACYVYSRYRGSCTSEGFYLRYAKLLKIIKEDNLTIVGTMQTIHHDHYQDFDYNNADVEVRVAIQDNRIIDGITKKVDNQLVASIIHYGSYLNMINTYQKIMKWLDRNNYTFLGNACENYLIDVVTTNNPSEYITELLLPIKKRK